MKIKWLKLHQCIDSNFKDGLNCLDNFDCYEEEFNGFQYRLYVHKDEFDDESSSLVTAVLGLYDVEFEQEHNPSIFQIPSTMINRIYSFINA
ncbi:hypothetical protein [Paenibacillus ferrarius]|uniref:hypothetical protein n=1 Tax=Paenibacillus ferrarius TaxID=1469647 RepID=UPI003D290B41